MRDMYVDDICSARNDAFKKLSNFFDFRFGCKYRVENDFYLACEQVKRNDDNTIEVDELPHVKNVDLLPNSCSVTVYRSRRQNFAWISQSGPKVCATIKLSSENTAQTFDKNHVTHLNMVMKLVRSTSTHNLKHHQMDDNSLRIIAFSDSPLFSNMALYT